jgi:hypothetical protein
MHDDQLEALRRTRAPPAPRYDAAAPPAPADYAPPPGYAAPHGGFAAGPPPPRTAPADQGFGYGGGFAPEGAARFARDDDGHAVYRDGAAPPRGDPRYAPAPAAGGAEAYAGGAGADGGYRRYAPPDADPRRAPPPAESGWSAAATAAGGRAGGGGAGGGAGWAGPRPLEGELGDGWTTSVM